jgi:hypothetical protein
MIQKENIRVITGQILKNSGKTNSTGLYNGKAGLSIVLFMAAEYLEDEHIEDIAYDLFQESLIIKNFDISFENGLSGIGYALLFLVEHEYIEVDFDQIFGMQYEAIIKNFENTGKDPARLVNSLQAIYFLSKVSEIKKEDKRIQEIIKNLFEGLELFLTVQFHDFCEKNYINRKADVLNIFITYLKLVDYSAYTHFSRSLLEKYAAQYRKGQIVSSLETGYYLSKIAAKYSITGYEDIINENINSGINNILICPLLLKERIDYAKIIEIINSQEIKTGDILHDIEELNPEKIEQDFLRIGNEKFFPYGYGAGLGRLLIYYVNNRIELL